MPEDIAWQWFATMVFLYVVGGISFIHPFVSSKENARNAFQQNYLSADTLGALAKKVDCSSMRLFRLWRRVWMMFAILYFSGPAIYVISGIQGYGPMLPDFLPIFYSIALPLLFVFGLGLRHFCRWRRATQLTVLAREVSKL